MSNDHPLLKHKLTYFLITALFIVVTAAAVAFFLVNVRIQTVEFENCVYSEQSVIEKAANIKKGTHSYAIDKDKIAKSIISASPYVTDVRIKRTSLTSISVILTEDAPRFYIERGGKFLLLSETLRVLARYDSLSEFSHKVHPIKLMSIKEAEIGKTVVFEKRENTEENPAALSQLSGEEALSLLCQISESKLSGTITLADLSNRFDLRFTYKDKYEIRFGATRDFEEKLALVIKTIAYLENPENGYAGAKGIIHASVKGETSFEPTGATENANPPQEQGTEGKKGT
jgi:hypothetical protein